MRWIIACSRPHQSDLARNMGATKKNADVRHSAQTGAAGDDRIFSPPRTVSVSFTVNFRDSCAAPINFTEKEMDAI